MKKYKLIKKYPGSPSLGDTVVKTKHSQYPLVKCNEYVHEIITTCTYGEYEVENYPEFWEEVKEKTYKILSWYFGDMNITIEPDGSAREYHIHSIKRLSDGEVFTVGDNIRNTKWPGYRGEISKITLVDSNIFVYYSTGCDLLDDISHNKQLKFKSEDGINLNYGDDCYIVRKPLDNKTTLTYSKFRKELLPNPSYRLIFSSKKAAENYIDLNKPTYSKAQLLIWLDNPKEAIKELLNK